MNKTKSDTSESLHKLYVHFNFPSAQKFHDILKKNKIHTPMKQIKNSSMIKLYLNYIKQ